MKLAGDFGREVALLQVTTARGGRRKVQALQFICDYILDRGHSPSMVDIARGLGLSKIRTKQLVDELTVDGSIERLAGSHRAITVPGLAQRIAIQQLRSLGFTVDEDILTVGGPYSAALPKDQLSLVAVIDHQPDDDRPIP